MPATFSAVVVSIPLSGTTSTDVVIPNAVMTALALPTMTAGSLYLQGNSDQTSANFTRICKSDGSSFWAWTYGTGSATISLQDAAFPYPYLRVEVSAPQTAVRSLTFICRTR